MANKGSPGISHLAKVLSDRAREEGSNAPRPSDLDYGVINKDYSLSLNKFTRKIPKSDYHVLRHISGEKMGTTRSANGPDAHSLAQPFRLEKRGINALADDEIHPGVGQVLHPHVHGRYGQPSQDQSDDDTRIHPDAALGHAGGDVHKALADEDEQEVQPHIDRSQDNVEHNGASRSLGMVIQPLQIFDDSFHSPLASLSSPYPVAPRKNRSDSAGNAGKCRSRSLTTSCQKEWTFRVQ